MTMEHEHCTLDPNGVQEEYADPDLPSYSESGYDYYSDGQTVSRGINDVSSDYIGSNHLWPTDTLTITNSDLSVLTRTEVAEIRNEIFARHGYVFSSSQWSDYFSTADWYCPDSSFSIARIRRSPMICSVRPKSRISIRSPLTRKRRDGISETTNLYAACIPVYRRMQQPASGARGTAAGTAAIGKN